MSRDRLYLIHISESVDLIEQYTRDGRAAFLEDRKTQDAVLRNLHTLSESVGRLSDAAKERHPEIEWRSIVAFRNVVVHDYLGIDLARVWDIVEADLPKLKQAAKIMLEESEGAGDAS